MTLTKGGVINQTADELSLSKKESAEILDTLIGLIKDSLESGEDVLVSGFGKFQVKEKAPRKGKNPATDEEMMLDARRVVKFKCSGKLRERINNHKKTNSG